MLNPEDLQREAAATGFGGEALAFLERLNERGETVLVLRGAGNAIAMWR